MKNESIRKVINVEKHNYSPVWTFKQEDDGVLKLELFKGSIPLDLTGQTIKLGVIRANKTLVELEDQSCFKINNNELDITLKNNILSVAGIAECDLELIDKDGKMTTASFFININKKTIGSNSIQASNEISSLEKLKNDFKSDVEGMKEEYNSWKDTVLAENNVAKLQNEINGLGSQLDNKASKDEVDVERKRIDSFTSLSQGSTTGDAELIDGRIGADGIEYENIGGSIRGQFGKINENAFEFEEININRQKGKIYNGYLPLTSKSGFMVAEITVETGDVFKLHTTTYGGDHFAYAFYNGEILVSNHGQGTASTYTDADVEIKIPKGVNKLIISGVAWDNGMFYYTTLSKKINKFKKIKDGIYTYKKVDCDIQIGKFSSNGSYELTTNQGYNVVLLNVNEGEKYLINTQTFGGSQYAYSFYDKNNINCGNYEKGVVSTATTINKIVKIPAGVTQMLICFNKSFMPLFYIKKVDEISKYEVEKSFIDFNDYTLKKGVLLQNGVTEMSIADYRTIEFDVIPGEKYYYIGGTFGGANYGYGFYSDETFLVGCMLGTSGTLTKIDTTFEVPSGTNKVKICWHKTFDGIFSIRKYIDVNEAIELLIQRQKYPLYNKKIAILGDSITADDYCGIGTMISNLLKANLVGNFAVGGATCADAVNGSTIDLIHDNKNTDNFGNSDNNVLSNQVRRLLKHTTATGEQIKWTHPIDGEFYIDTSYGTGLGNTTDVPEVIYIAISTNDGGSRTGTIVDDTDTVFNQTYSQLTRKTIASALRWAIETLQSAYPEAVVYVATPLWTGSSYEYANYSNTKLKAEIIKKVADFCSVRVIDSQSESGYNKMYALSGSDSAYIHPDEEWRYNIAKYVANEISNRHSTKGNMLFEE